MRVRWSALAVALLLLAGCGKPETGPVRAPGAGGLVLATTSSNEPYSFVDEATGEVVGSDVELAKAVARKMGLPLRIVLIPFSDLQPRVKTGEVDFAAGSITITEGRRRDVDFSVPYASDGSAFLYRAGEPVPSIPRGPGLRIGTLLATVNHFYLCFHNLDPICYRTYEEAVADFAAGRLDCVFYDAAPIRHTVAKSKGLYAVSPLETREHYGIAVRKDYPALLQAVNAAIRERRAGK